MCLLLTFFGEFTIRRFPGCRYGRVDRRFNIQVRITRIVQRVHEAVCMAPARSYAVEITIGSHRLVSSFFTQAHVWRKHVRSNSDQTYAVAVRHCS